MYAFCSDFSERTAQYAITCQKQQEASINSEENTQTSAPGYLVTDLTVSGLCGTRWPDRSQTLKRPECGITYYIDGAHTGRSMQVGEETLFVSGYLVFPQLCVMGGIVIMLVHWFFFANSIYFSNYHIH